MTNVSLLVTIVEARKILGMPNSTFYRIKKSPGFPKPRYIEGRKRPLYIRKELEEWVSKLP